MPALLDAQLLTLLVERVGFVLASPALARSRDPKTGRFVGPTHLCRSCGRPRPHHRCRTGASGCTHCDVCGTMLDPAGPRAITTTR